MGNESKFRAAEERLWESEGLKPMEHFVRLPRIATRVRIQEVGDGDPVLFIHGGPNSGSTWAQSHNGQRHTPASGPAQSDGCPIRHRSLCGPV